MNQKVEEAHTYLQGIVDTIREPFVVMDADLRVVSVNRSFSKTFQVSPEKIENRVIYELGSGEWNIPALQWLLKQLLSNDTQIENFELKHEFPAIGYKIMVLNARKLRHPSNPTEMILLAIEDITVMRQGEQALRETNERFRLLVENAKDYAMLVLDIDGKIVSWTPGAERIMGWQETEVLGQHVHLIFTLEDRDNAVPEQELLKAASEGRAEDKRWHLRKDGSRFFADGVMTSLRDHQGSIQGFGKVLLDATERKQAEDALRESESRLKFALDSAQIGSWDLDLLSEPHTAVRSLKHDQIFGYKSLLSNWSYEIFLKHVHPDDRELVAQKFKYTLSTHEHWDFECRIIWPDQSIHWIWGRGSVYCDSSNKPTRLSGLVTDITERKQAEEKIKASLQEKEVLLKEVHHRVKNNLQIISGLLYLQSRYVKDEPTLQVLQENRNRIQSMALIHEKLYGSKAFNNIDFKDYIYNLLQNLFISYGVNRDVITLKISIGPVCFDIDTAIHCGLIINELVSNALKHAFCLGQTGEIVVQLHATENNKFELIVSDSGVGFPKEIDFEKQKSLGLRLVHSLVNKQLEGTIELDTTQGARFNICFKA